MENVSNNEESIEQLAKRYKKMRWGYIAKAYSQNEEEETYKEIANIISDKYGHIVSFDEIVERLSKRGHIYTMDICGKKDGFYEFKTGNVGLSHFLNRITTVSLHEFIHKIGFESGETSFKEMSIVFNEAGTDLVDAKSLSDKEKREFIFHKVWGKVPEKVNDNVLNICLTNQLNEAVGGESLENSILKGKDFFKTAIIDKYGEASYVFLKENIEDLSRYENKYWSDYSYLTDEAKLEKEDELKKRIFLIQDYILEIEFDRRLEEVNSLESAKKFLNDLNEFGLNRVKIKQYTEDGREVFVDPGFKEHFEKYKQNLEMQYGTTGIIYDESVWEKLYEEKETENEISDEEKVAIRDLSIIFKKAHSNKNLISKIFGNKTKKQPALPESLDYNNEGSIFESLKYNEEEKKNKSFSENKQVLTQENWFRKPTEDELKDR